MPSFEAQLDDFADATEDDLTAIFRQSVQDLFAVAQKPVAKGGRMRVDTGNLRNSFGLSVNGAALQQDLGKGDAYVAKLADLEAGDSIFGGWTATYAAHREYGTRRGGKPDFYMRGAANQWQRIVLSNAARLFA